MRKPALVLATGLLVGACGSDGGGGSPPGTAESELAQARALWDDAGIDDYEWTFTRYCFCPPLKVRVRVVDGIARERTVLEGPQEQTSFDFLTMEALYDEIEEEIEASEEVTARYDTENGRVRRVRFDRYLNAIDDELEYRISGFTVTS